MKTGKQTRLGEKLNAELDTIRQDYAASMASQLESFRIDLNDIATNAQRTIEIDNSLGARLARLRRAVGDGLRNLSEGIERLGSTLDEKAANPVGWYSGMRDVARTLADRVNAGAAWLAERRGHLQRAGRTVERELELSEGRRREAETELEAREVEMDRGLSH